MGFTCLLQGGDTLTIHCGGMLLEAGHSISAVITSEPRVMDWARQAKIDVIATEDAKDKAKDHRVDWLLSIANTDIIPKAVLSAAQKGGVNFHDGPLPKYAGLNAPVWALIHGEPTHGISWHLLTDGIDEGDIVASRNFAVAPDDTALTLNAKCFSAAAESFHDVMTALASDLPDVTSQDLAARSYFGRDQRPKAGGVLDFSQPAADILRLVRALDHGTYRNPLAIPKVVSGDTVLLVTNAVTVDGNADPGKITAIYRDSMTVGTSDGLVQLSGLRDSLGNPVPPPFAAGETLGSVDAETLDAAIQSIAASEPKWAKRLADYQPLKWLGETDETGTKSIQLSGDADALRTAFALSFFHHAAFSDFDVAMAEPDAMVGASLGWRPVRVTAAETIQQTTAALKNAFETAQSNGPVSADLIARLPGIDHRSLPDIAFSKNGPVPGAGLTLVTSAQGTRVEADLSRVTSLEAELIAARVEHMAAHMKPDANDPLASLPVLPAKERETLLTGWNATEAKYEKTKCIHQLFEAQATKTPTAEALTFEDISLSYEDLNARANQVAHVLIEMGVTPGQPVGLHVNRSAELLIGALGILKAGGAYLPLDPAYPADRIKLYVEDSGTKVIVGETGLALETEAAILNIDADDRIDAAKKSKPKTKVKPSDLAYVIYTSGSTGKPKGVMVEHRNVTNFFTGMDDRISHTPAGVLLAVTSLSFDISVLELFWTLSRGFKIVMSGEEKMVAGADASSGGMDFSLFYWGNDKGEGRDKYELLLEGAKFADTHGFAAVWTPERHFHAFGGLYPNPSVTGAAVAAVTKNIAVRAGSCVAPLHHPARIAEEWAVIDNLTNGRAGLAFASGWQPDDFVLRPENAPPSNKPAMLDTIEEVRKLWRGEAVEFANAGGKTVECLTQPRPVSKDLPVWITTAGNPETWQQAGAIGANVLTHLLGQTIEEVGEKIEIYHQALRDAGHDPADFTVTLMLHTFIGENRDTVRDIAREPMKDYLRSAADLIKQYAWAFPAFKKPEGVEDARQLDLGSLEPDELEAILDFAFERYFEQSGLFGTLEDAMTRIAEIRAIGVTETACLIDFGIERQVILDGLTHLAKVVAQTTKDQTDYSLAAQIERHEVTHMQCTPYMARMMLTNDASTAALGKLKHLMIGGEALPAALIADLEDATDANIENMYGPTETTIWSTTAKANGQRGVVSIGTPIANTQIYVLNDAMEPVPTGAPGHLWIAGDGVTRGYWKRDDLTKDRFHKDPFRKSNRMFKTGDLAQWQSDGTLVFLGRSDAQVKIRGYRMELGEIEAALETNAGVTQAVVIVRDDASGVGQLIAYVTGDAAEADLKAGLANRLPAFMVPNRIVKLDAFPLTPNKKIDRNALPDPQVSVAPPVVEPVAAPIATDAPSTDQDLKKVIATIWAQVLNVGQVEPNDNFFDLGGHSLLAVEAHRAVRSATGLNQLSIADIFRAPTLAGFTARAEALRAPPELAPVEEPVAKPKADGTVASRRRALRQQRWQNR